MAVNMIGLRSLISDEVSDTQAINYNTLDILQIDVILFVKFHVQVKIFSQVSK